MHKVDKAGPLTYFIVILLQIETFRGIYSHRMVVRLIHRRVRTTVKIRQQEMLNRAKNHESKNHHKYLIVLDTTFSA